MAIVTSAPLASLFLLFLLLVTPCTAFKFLMFPLNNRSHLLEFHGLGRTLLSRGHEVHFCLSKFDPPPGEVAKAGYKFIHPNVNESLVPFVFDEAQVIDSIDKSFFRQFIEAWDQAFEFIENVKRLAGLLVDDEELLAKLRAEKYDFMLVDTIFLHTHVFLIPRKLGVPYGGLTALYVPLLHRVPNFPSAFPDINFSTWFGVQPGLLGSSMWERSKNCFTALFSSWYARGWTEELFKREGTSFEELLSNVVPHLVDQHSLLADPMPTMPHVKLVGGLTTGPAKPVTDPALLSFIQSTDHPIVICTFGTLMESLTPKITSKLYGAFARLPHYKFVVRLKRLTKNDSVPDNVLVLKWLPQNDLLGHNRTALLITHSGNNGQNEALYHAVPMVAFYIFGDQLYNADRADRRGYGVKLNLLSFSEDELVDAVKEVMTNDSYRRNIRAASEIFRLRDPAVEAAEFLEHVIQFGSDHLRADEAFQLSLTQFMMLDVALVLFTALTLTLACVYATLRVLINIISRLLTSGTRSNR